MLPKLQHIVNVINVCFLLFVHALHNDLPSLSSWSDYVVKKNCQNFYVVNWFVTVFIDTGVSFFSLWYSINWIGCEYLCYPFASFRVLIGCERFV